MQAERLSDEVRGLLEAAQQQAVMNYNQELTTVHLLSAMCSQPDGFFKFVLKSLNVDEAQFSREVDRLLNGPGVRPGGKGCRPEPGDRIPSAGRSL